MRHSVKIQDFFCHSDFTWNQSWQIQSLKNCHFVSFVGSKLRASQNLISRKICDSKNMRFPHCGRQAQDESPKVCPNEFVRKLLQKIISFIIMLFSSKNSDIFAQNPNALLPKGMDQKQCCQLWLWISVFCLIDFTWNQI